ncbi:MAG: DUF4178 domain-containing protein, partial [Chrysiogenales bacterium]
MGADNPELKTVRCTGCGGNLVKTYRVEYDDEDEESVHIPLAQCASCNHEYDRTTPEYYLFFADDLTYDKDLTVFTLGVKGTLKGVEYEIIGRIRYQEEEEWEKATWDEWFAVSSDGGYHYFIEEDGEIRSYEEYTPDSIDIESDPHTILFEGKRISKDTGFVGRIVYAEGELPWKPEIGEPSTMYDFKKDGIHYSIEHSEGEVSVTRGEKVPFEDIVNAFGKKEDRELYGKTVTARKRYTRKALVYTAAGIVALVLAVVGCLSSSPVDGVMKENVELSANLPVVEGTEKMFRSEIMYGPFALDRGDRLYTARVSINRSVQNLHLEWQSFRLLLIPEDRLRNRLGNNLTRPSLSGLFDEVDALAEPLECYTMGGDFWDEEGYDDGYWHESDVTAEDDFILEKAGNY